MKNNIVTGNEYDVPHADTDELRSVSGCAKFLGALFLIAVGMALVAVFVFG